MMRNLEPGRGGALVGATNALSSNPRTPRTPSTPSRTDDGGSRTLSTNLGSQWAACSIDVGTRGSDEGDAAELGREGLITLLASHLMTYTGDTMQLREFFITINRVEDRERWLAWP